jgi:hypothetical protein
MVLLLVLGGAKRMLCMIPRTEAYMEPPIGLFCETESAG